MLIVDAHLDLSWNALQWGRDLTRSVYTIRTQENTTPGKGRGLGTVAYPEMRQGRVALSIATVLARSTGQPVPNIDYATPAQSYGIAQGQLAYYRALERSGEIRVVADLAGLDSHMAEWEAWEREQGTGDRGQGTEEAQALHRSSFIVDRSFPPLGLVISMEGADPILAPDQLEEWWDAGLRLLGITHYGPGRYAGGTATELGLTELGPPLLAEMQRLGVVLDLTHCSDQAFWQALERYSGPVIASHNNCRALVPHQRQFSDDQLRVIVERDGVIGAALDTWMVKPGWRIGEHPHPANPTVTLADVADHIDHVCQLAGNSRHAAIGSDLDGGFGREQSPQDLDTIADLQKLAGLLAARGYAEGDIAAIMHGNWLRLLRRVWAT
ncbi:MAG TPA: membrane dipeptidase [Roseiflexaceae bacterium]|nr:membrane dipeptidase [Roseiflexaceae bacterium]